MYLRVPLGSFSDFQAPAENAGFFVERPFAFMACGVLPPHFSPGSSVSLKSGGGELFLQATMVGDGLVRARMRRLDESEGARDRRRPSRSGVSRAWASRIWYSAVPWEFVNRERFARSQ